MAEVRHAGVDAISQLACAAFTPRHHSDEDRSIRSSENERATTVALAGVDAALAQSCAHHTGLDFATVCILCIASDVLNVGDFTLLQNLGGRPLFRCPSPACDFKDLAGFELLDGLRRGDDFTGWSRCKLDQGNIVFESSAVITTMDKHVISLAPGAARPFGYTRFDANAPTVKPSETMSGGHNPSILNERPAAKDATLLQSRYL